MIIGICGGTGSGKTTLARKIVELVGEDRVNLIEQDFYYKDLKDLPLERRREVNFDHPDSIDFANLGKDLEGLIRGETVEVPTYDFSRHVRTDSPLKMPPKPVTIVEGILVLSVESIRRLFDISVFLDTDSDTRLLRRIKRDIKERGRTLEQTLEQYERTIRPMHREFVQPSKRTADIVIPQNKQGEAIVSLLVALIQQKIGDNAEGQHAS